MPPHATGGEALCFVGAPDHEEAVRLACAELNARGYVCERLIDDSIWQIVPARWDERVQEICKNLESRFSSSKAAVLASLPDAARIRQLRKEGGFFLGPFYCWDTEPDQGPEEVDDDAE
jgi:hypothetical protein